MAKSYIFDISNKLTHNVRLLPSIAKDNPLAELKSTVESVKATGSERLNTKVSVAQKKAERLKALFDDTWMEVKDHTNLSIAQKNRIYNQQTKQWDVLFPDPDGAAVPAAFAPGHHQVQQKDHQELPKPPRRRLPLAQDRKEKAPQEEQRALHRQPVDPPARRSRPKLDREEPTSSQRQQNEEARQHTPLHPNNRIRPVSNLARHFETNHSPLTYFLFPTTNYIYAFELALSSGHLQKPGSQASPAQNRQAGQTRASKQPQEPSRRHPSGSRSASQASPAGPICRDSRT